MEMVEWNGNAVGASIWLYLRLIPSRHDRNTLPATSLMHAVFRKTRANRGLCHGRRNSSINQRNITRVAQWCCASNCSRPKQLASLCLSPRAAILLFLMAVPPRRQNKGVAIETDVPAPMRLPASPRVDRAAYVTIEKVRNQRPVHTSSVRYILMRTLNENRSTPHTTYNSQTPNN